MTFSIVARDADTGEIGVAIQSFYFGFGARGVVFARSGAGVVVTQMLNLPAYGVEGLLRLARGDAPAAVLADITAGDPDPEHRQVTMMIRRG